MLFTLQSVVLRSAATGLCAAVMSQRMGEASTACVFFSCRTLDRISEGVRALMNKFSFSALKRQFAHCLPFFFNEFVSIESFVWLLFRDVDFVWASSVSR